MCGGGLGVTPTSLDVRVETIYVLDVEVETVGGGAFTPDWQDVQT